MPLEAQRLGLESYASDLNPVAVLITKAMIEIPPKFAGRPPVNPATREDNTLFSKEWTGTQGLAEDVRYYGQWMKSEAKKKIGQLYPQVEVTAVMAAERPDLMQYVGRKLTVIAWLWARTVKSPNPAFADVAVPLAVTFMLSTKKGREAYIEPVIDKGDYRFKVKVGNPGDAQAAKDGTMLGRGTFRCLLSGAPIAGEYIKAEGKAGRMGARLMAIIAEGNRGRVYLAPTPDHETTPSNAQPKWRPEGDVPARLTGGTCVPYGLEKWSDLFTPRQLVALTTFSDLVQEARNQVINDALAAGMADESFGLDSSGTSATAYGDAVALYLGLGVGRSANYWSSLTPWGGDFIVQTFERQAIPMVWDHAEGNPFSSSTGNWTGALNWIEKVIVNALPGSQSGLAVPGDAQTQSTSHDKVVSKDPPYYDNIAYADLPDFFYVWLRRSLRPVFPDLFATMAVPKAEELVALTYRHGSKEQAETFFLSGMTQAMNRLAEQVHPAFPVTIYYAFKQSENKGDAGTSRTGWETFLDAVIRAGFAISGTWPVRTERDQGLKTGTNVLASSIVLVCRHRDAGASTATRREFVAVLREELPQAIKHLQQGNVAPVDLAQAAIGPGMATFTRYAKVLDASGEPMPVRDALALINRTLDEVLAEQEGDFDADSRWALTWFEQFGFAEGEFGVAETLSKAKNTSVAGMEEADILVAAGGKVRLLRPEEFSEDWDPLTDTRTPAWECVHHLVRAQDEGRERAAAALMSKLGAERSEVARELAYRLYTICERKGWAKEALSYNSLVQSWPEISSLARVDQSAEQGALL